jgi:uncharacterized membrane protein YuzA (DUF378 family)
MPTVSTPAHSRSFDPARPLEHTTLRNFRATGVGQASPKRLAAFVVVGLAGVVTLLSASTSWWPFATPFVCLACFGVWGRSAQWTSILDIRHERRATLRRVLRGIRWLMVGIGAAAAIAGLIGGAMMLLEPSTTL